MFFHILKWYEPVCVCVYVRVRVHVRVRVRLRESVRVRERECVCLYVYMYVRVWCVCSVCVCCVRVWCASVVCMCIPYDLAFISLSHSRTPSLHRLLLISIPGHSYNGRIVPRYESKFFFWAHSGVFFRGTVCSNLLDRVFTAAKRNVPHALQRTATHCNALQRTATHCNALQRTATHCNLLRHTATHCNALQRTTVDTYS